MELCFPSPPPPQLFCCFSHSSPPPPALGEMVQHHCPAPVIGRLGSKLALWGTPGVWGDTRLEGSRPSWLPSQGSQASCKFRDHAGAGEWGAPGLGGRCRGRRLGLRENMAQAGRVPFLHCVQWITVIWQVGPAPGLGKMGVRFRGTTWSRMDPNPGNCANTHQRYSINQIGLLHAMEYGMAMRKTNPQRPLKGQHFHLCCP